MKETLENRTDIGWLNNPERKKLWYSTSTSNVLRPPEDRKVNERVRIGSPNK